MPRLAPPAENFKADWTGLAFFLAKVRSHLGPQAPIQPPPWVGMWTLMSSVLLKAE